MSYQSATRGRPRTQAPADGSRTIVLHDSQPREEERGATSSGSGDERQSDSQSGIVGVLRLRGAPRSRPRVAWTEDVVDNEGMGKKKSKICCIYHKPRKFDESSSESSDSDSDSDSGSCGGHGHDHQHHNHNHRARPANRRSHGEDSERRPEGGEQAMRDGGGSGTVQELEDPEPNAYERRPGKGKGKRSTNGKRLGGPVKDP